MERTETEQAPRLRLRRTLAAWGLMVLTILVGFTAWKPAPAYAWTVPSPVVNPFGTILSTGTGVGAGATGTTGVLSGLCAGTAATGCVVLAGAGSFAGTCWVLGQVFDDPDGCADGVKALISFIPGVGDDRATYTGPAALIGVTDYSGATNGFTARFLNAEQSPATPKVIYGSTTGGECYVSSTASFLYPTKTVSISAADPQVTKENMKIALGDPNGYYTGVSGSCGSGTKYVKSITVSRTNSPFTQMAEWIADPGYGTPWELTASQNCIRPDGTTFVVSDALTFTPVAGLETPQIELQPCWEVVPGSRMDTMNVTGDRAGITSPNPAVDIEVGGTPQDIKDAYPLCTTDAPAGGCWLDLQRDGQSCFSAGTYCAGWLQNTTRWNMSCEWGPYQLAMSKCEEKYATVFNLQPAPKPSPSPSPTPVPTSPPTVGPNPESPPTDPTIETDPDSRSCFGEAWSMNPVDWVYVPVKCAFLWAFKPSVSLQTRVTNVQEAYADAPPFTWFAQFGALPTVIGSSSCPDWEVHVANLDKNIVCESSFTQAIRNGRPAFAAMMIAAAFAPFLRSLAYSAVPILSPVPH